jgi:hypothetical protein
MSNKNLPPIGKPTLAEAISLSKQQTKLEINAIKIGRIEAFNPSTQRADVSIAHKQVVDVMEDGTKVYADYPVIMECPVVVLFGGVDFMSMPIQVGDSCILFFNDNEIDQWSNNGNGQVCSTFRMHDISDAIALVGLRSLTNSIATYLANGIRLSHGAGDDATRIDLTDALISSFATLWEHNGSMRITGDLTVVGDMYGEGSGGGTIRINSNIEQQAGRTLKAGNGATGTFSTVTVEDGIVTGGS